MALSLYGEYFSINVDLEFFDANGSGEFRAVLDPPERAALLGPGGAAQAWCTQMGPCKPTELFQANGTRIGPPVMMQGTEPIGPPKMSVKLPPAPVAKFKDLEAAVNSTAKYNLLPMKVRADFIPVTGSSVLSNITIQFERKDLQFKQKGEISTATRQLVWPGHFHGAPARLNWFEDVVSVDIPDRILQQAVKGASIYQKTLPLQPGRYRLNIAAKDIVGGNTTNFEMVLEVPRLEATNWAKVR